MKRIKAACLEQTIHFQLKDGDSREMGRQRTQREYEAYRAQLDRSRIPYVVLEESEQADGSLIIKLKRQNGAQPVGDYFQPCTR